MRRAELDQTTDLHRAGKRDQLGRNVSIIARAKAGGGLDAHA